MDAKDIAALFRSVVEAEDQALLGITRTFADQDFFIQLGWFADQIQTRFKKNTPSPDTLALMAALGGFMKIKNSNDGIDKAYEVWQAGDKRVRKETLCSREEIEENLSQVGVEFRRAQWPKNEDGTERKNLDLTPFLRLCIPLKGQDTLEARFKEYLKDNPLGAKPRTPAEVEIELKAIKAEKFVPGDLYHEGSAIVAWWMKQTASKPLNFPDGSFGDLAKRALGFTPRKREPKTGGKEPAK